MPVLHGGVAHIAELRLSPGGLAAKKRLSSRMLACVSFLRCWPWKLAPPTAAPLPSLGRKLLCEARASISVPSTEKCSSDNSGLTCGWFSRLLMNLANLAVHHSPVGSL